MLFQHTLDLLLSGRKTQTCRIAKPGEVAVPGQKRQIEAVVANGRDKYRVGKSYAVQPARGKPAVARIRLLAIARKNIADADDADATAEGYATRDEFLEVWRQIHGASKLHADVWVLKFELVVDK